MLKVRPWHGLKPDSLLPEQHTNDADFTSTSKKKRSSKGSRI